MSSSNEVKSTDRLLAVDLLTNDCLTNKSLQVQSYRPILAIDGPAGAGKSTVARLVAQQLGLFYLDTGAMYRAITWLVLQMKISLDNEVAIAELAKRCQIQLIVGASFQDPLQVWIDKQEITDSIRTLEVTAHVPTISAQPAVRQALIKQQQSYGQMGGLVAEGRDIGTNVFPNAKLKIFLTASVQERTRRRYQELAHKGDCNLSFSELGRAIYERDQKDSTRVVSPLCKAMDAIEIQTDRLSITDVINQIVRLYNGKLDSSL